MEEAEWDTCFRIFNPVSAGREEEVVKLQQRSLGWGRSFGDALGTPTWGTVF